MAIKIINKVGQYQTIYYYDYGISLTKNNFGNKYCHYTRIYNAIGNKKSNYYRDESMEGNTIRLWIRQTLILLIF